jgi:protein involved in polysaccharide export with SLBB domain
MGRKCPQCSYAKERCGMRRTLLIIAAVIAAQFGFATSVVAQRTAGPEETLRPGDLLRVAVWPDAELSGEFPIETDGLVYLPFLGGVQATGIPVDQLRRDIRAGFQSAQRNAVVAVTPLYRIGVTGSVRQPGAYLVPPTDGFFDVIAQAGGFDIRAKENEVRVVRDGQVIVLNAEDAINKGETLPLDALSLRSGDQIIVPFGAEPWGARDWIALGNFAISLILLWDRLAND